MKLSHQAFIELNDDLVKTFYEAATLNKWQGHRLLALDGSVTQFPNSDELLSHFWKSTPTSCTSCCASFSTL